MSGAEQRGKAKDTIKLRSKGTKSVAELEMVVESLKRVIDKQKTEADELRKQLDQHDKVRDKLKSEKQLRQKIETLEMEVHNHEMRDLSLDEKDTTIKKLLGANKHFREDMERELERYTLLEKKYKDLLVKYNVVARENARNQETLFNLNTGTNLHNYEEFLEDKPAKRQDRARAKDSFDRAYEEPF